MIKKKLTACIILFVAGIYPGLFISYNAHFFLLGNRDIVYSPIRFINGALRERNIVMFFGFFLLLLITAVAWVAVSTSTLNYRSGLREIIPGIKTPLPYGENQHGSAR